MFEEKSAMGSAAACSLRITCKHSHSLMERLDFREPELSQTG